MKIKQLLLDYTSDKYEYAGELKYSPLSQYFNTDSTYGRLYAGFCNTSLQYLIYARQCRSADLRYDEASFVLNVESATVKKGVYTINYTISEKGCVRNMRYPCRVLRYGSRGADFQRHRREIQV